MEPVASTGMLLSLYKAINNGDISSAVKFYEPDAKIISESGRTIKGWQQIREYLEQFIEKRPTVIALTEELIETEDFTICLFRSRLLESSTNESPIQVEGSATMILRRQLDGSWRIAIESPWAASILM